MSRKPKDVLMTHANENPTQTLVVSQHGASYTFDTIFHNPADALFMLYLLETHLKKSLEKGMQKVDEAKPPTVLS